MYPAIFLSSFRPITLLKGHPAAGTRRGVLRKSLVILQFAVSIGMIAGTITVYSQLDYMREKDLGFNHSEVIAIPTNGELTGASLSAVERELGSYPGVQSVAFASSLPDGKTARTIFHLEIDGVTQAKLFPYVFVDQNYLSLMQIELTQGRNFSTEMRTDARSGFIINETAAKQLGWKNPVGEEVHMQQTDEGSYLVNGKVIGVMRDYHFASLHNPIEPLILRFTTEPDSGMESGYVLIRLNGRNVAATLHWIAAQWKKYDSRHPFDFAFLDSSLGEQYSSEEKLGVLFGVFCALAVFISCLGLFALAAFIAEHRTKEIGIRKTLGASVANVTTLLSKDFVMLVLAANVIAWPVAWYVMTRWLQNFAYRIEISWWVFVLAGGLALLIALLTVSTQAIKAALANPVEALRYE
jgi:putative ABC transport system permease protein